MKKLLNASVLALSLTTTQAFAYDYQTFPSRLWGEYVGTFAGKQNNPISPREAKAVCNQDHRTFDIESNNTRAFTATINGQGVMSSLYSGEVGVDDYLVKIQKKYSDTHFIARMRSESNVAELGSEDSEIEIKYFTVEYKLQNGALYEYKDEMGKKQLTSIYYRCS